ncbi:hypothetical protein QYE76_041370 [Lolium multiflorum]|uniref:RNase H type-1 domain-containing protein n=1 Tax=Lolium multiflorum TaxID=4521 RepID=A0AAD8WTQ7_LOLMU|nr:hypothetical protein QYE76_041370 [Lolium multiflorum]
MNFDGSKRLEGAGAGVILVSPEGDKLKYVLRMTFPNASNNEAEYEALIHGMKMAKACGATRLKIFGDSQLVAQQVMNQCDAVNESMIAYKEVYNELEKSFDGCEWIEAKPINSPDSASAIKFVKSIVFRFGVPHSIVTDNGSNFTSKEFKAYLQKWASN